uniref:Putative DNA polymerase n=1 Tax=viral metagenome TaxID=1070528 RepID=A0A6H1ZB72_9ZZZZ
MDCNLCPLRAYTTNPVFGFGNLNADIMLIGECPATKETLKKEPFVGKSGDLLNDILKSAKLKRNELFIANIINCQPPKNNIDFPDAKIALKKCPEIHLLPSIKKVSPKVIILLGNVPHRYFFNSEGITKKRGILREWRGFKVVPTLHPAFLLREHMHLKEDVINDFKYAKSLLTDTKHKIDYRIITTSSEFTAAIAHITSCKCIGVDVETTGLKVFKGDKIIGIGICINKDFAYYFPFRKTGFLNTGLEDIWNKEQIQQLINILENKNIIKTFHNSNFDCEFLNIDLGVDCVSIRDSLLLAHLLDENRQNNLESLTDTHYLDMVGYKKASEDLLKKHVDFTKLPADIVAKRCALDAIATYRLTDDFTKEIKNNESLYNYYQRFQLPLMPLLRKIQKRGFKIDIPYAQTIEKKYKNELDGLTYKIWKEAGYRFNVKSSDQLRALFADLKFPIIGLTKKEKMASTDIDTLKELKRITKHPIIDLILKYKKLEKLYTTYAIGLQKEAVDDIIHCKMNQCKIDKKGTTTGRLSSSEPNQQNIASNKDIKNMVCAREGYSLMQGDLKQAEVRVLAFLSKDHKLLDACMSSDIYKTMAVDVFHVSYEDVVSEQRDVMKTVVLGTLYGMGLDSLAALLNMSKRKAGDIQNKFFGAFKDAYKWVKEVKRFVHVNGYIQTVYGRIRHLPYIMSRDEEIVAEAERQAVNSMVQSPTFDYVSMALRRVDDALSKFDGGIIITVHDSIVVEIREEQVNEFISIMVDCMTQPVLPINVPMAVDIEVGKSWGNLINCQVN